MKPPPPRSLPLTLPSRPPRRGVELLLPLTMSMLGCPGEPESDGGLATTVSEPAPGSSGSPLTGDGDTGLTTGQPSVDSGSGSVEPPSSDSSTDTDPDPPSLFDVGTIVDAGTPGGVKCGCGNDEWSYLWVANSGGTVSKINTRTLEEEGRYTTAPGFADPSRTSVSIDGRAMVVANRWDASMTKIWSRPEFCEDRNGNGDIDTSFGSADVRAWGGDECVAWHLDIPGMTEQRPVQWTTGVLDETTCEYVGQKIWTVTFNENAPAGVDRTFVHLVDGDTGVIEQTIPLPADQWDADEAYFGAYGGAVDGDGNFYFHRHGFSSQIGRVTLETMALELWSPGDFASISGYGITVDTEGSVWFTNPLRKVDFDARTVVDAPNNAEFSDLGGLAEDQQGRIWAPYDDGAQIGVYWVDRDTLALGDIVVLINNPNATVKGVSVDVDGYVWAVPRNGFAYRVDPETLEVESYEGLNSPYTYSDMTGGQLKSVNCGGGPQG